MAISVTFNGTTYSIPTAGETNWPGLTFFLRDLAAGVQVNTAQNAAIRRATTTPVTVAATDYTVVVDLASPGASVVNLPAGVTKTIYVIVDGKGDAGTNNITVQSGASQDINSNASYVINENYGGIMLQFDGSEWVILAGFLGNDPKFASLTVTSLGAGVVKSSASGVFSSALILDADVSPLAAIGGAKIANSPSGNLSATDVQSALNELQTDIDTRTTSTDFNTHVADTSTHGITSAIVGTGETQTLTNKSIDATQNTITNIKDVNVASDAAVAASKLANTPSGNLAATDVQTALNELQSDIDTRATSAALTAHTGASSGVHGLSGAVVGTTDAQTVSNKSLSAATFPDAVKILEVASPSTPPSGYVYFYAKVDGNLYQKDDAGTETNLATGGGGGGSLDFDDIVTDNGDVVVDTVSGNVVFDN